MFCNIELQYNSLPAELKKKLCALCWNCLLCNTVVVFLFILKEGIGVNFFVDCVHTAFNILATTNH